MLTRLRAAAQRRGVSSQSLSPADVNAGLVAAWPEAAVDISCKEVSRTHALVSYSIPHEVIRPGGFISGPAQFTLCDLAMWCSCFGVLNRVEPMALTSELSIRFVRPAIGAVLWARTDVSAVSGRSVVSTTTLWTDENSSRPCSLAQGTYVLPRRESRD